MTHDDMQTLIAGEAAREADFLEKTVGLEEKLGEHRHATPQEWEYLRRIIAKAMHLVDQVPQTSQESMRLYRALQRARVELGNPPAETH